MQFIAAFWFLWLIGISACFAFNVYRWVNKLGGTTRRIAEITQIGMDVYAAERNQKTNLLAERGLSAVRDEAKGWASEMAIVAISTILLWTFSFLLVISIVVHLINYLKA